MRAGLLGDAGSCCRATRSPRSGHGTVSSYETRVGAARCADSLPTQSGLGEAGLGKLTRCPWGPPFTCARSDPRPHLLTDATLPPLQRSPSERAGRTARRRGRDVTRKLRFQPRPQRRAVHAGPCSPSGAEPRGRVQVLIAQRPAARCIGTREVG